MSAMDARQAEILATIAGMIKDVIGEEWVAETPITMDTKFVQDLEVESIELVALSERIQAQYGATVDFPQWLSGMELDRIIALSVGDLVEYIAACQAKS